MPESPEVDALAAFLRDTVIGARVEGTDLAEFRALKTRARPLGELVGARVTDVQRYGKHVALMTDGADLVVSFGRAGWAAWRAADAAPSAEADAAASAAPVIATVDFAGRGELALTDAGDWLSLGVSVVDDPREVPAVAKLGPDPLVDDWTRADLDALVAGRRKRLKALLQEQESLAGIGNAYSDEILYTAALSPLAQASALDEDERGRLYDAVVGVLGAARDARRGVPIAQQKAAKVAAMHVHGRTGDPCGAGGAVLDVPGSKGSAQYCPDRQTGGVPLPE